MGELYVLLLVLNFIGVYLAYKAGYQRGYEDRDLKSIAKRYRSS